MQPNLATTAIDLREADRLREGTRDERAQALAAYLDNADSIDPTEPDGAERVLWILVQGRALDLRLESLVRHAAASACEAELREVAEIMLFQFPLRRGDVAGAERHLRTLLEKYRRSGNPREIGVLNDLALVYQNSQREFETLVIGRRALDLATARAASGDAPPTHTTMGLAISNARVMWALERLEEWEELELQALAMMRLLPELADWHKSPALRTVHTARRAIRLAARDWDGARREHALLVAAGPPVSADTDDAFDGALLEALIALASGRPSDAAVIALPASRSQPVGSRRWFAATDLLVRSIAAASVDPRPAVGTAMMLREAICEPAALKLGVSTLLGIATAVGVALGEHPTAALFFESASEFLLRRISEVHECVANIEELSTTAWRDRELLARHRARYVADHRRALAAIAQIYDDPGVPRPPQLECLASHDRIRICAWCLTMRTPDGRTLPIGHLLPDSARLGVTHGICDECRDGITP